MNTIQSVPSIHRKMNRTYIIFNTIAFILGCLLVIFLINTNAKNNMLQNGMQWAKIINHQSVKALLENTPKRLNDDLQALTVISTLNYVYVYHIENTDAKKLSLFSEYSRGNKNAPITKTQTQLSRLITPHFSDDYVEFVLPINNEQQLLGYLYVQFNLSDLNLTLLKDAILIFAIAGTVLLIAFAIMAKLVNSITEPISILVNDIQLISKTKDFTLRCQPMPYRELDILAQNLNIMLTRAERFIAKQTEAEQQFIQLNKSLEDKVNQRTEALKESNQELLATLETLHQYQGQIVENEKMASLGDMVAGVAHEVNTPIGLGVTSSSLLYDRLNEIKTAFENKTLKSSQLKRFLSDGDENLQIIMRNLQRAADLITSFKQVAVDQSSSEERRFNFKALLKEVLLTLAPQLKNTEYNIELNCPEDLIITSKPGPINQVVLNLILNSIIHGFENSGSGNITITVVLLKNLVNIQYIDNGKGIDDSVKDKIFDPFITTKRGSGGSGLGMHLVYNLITQALGGTISFESERNKGVTFDINFPIHS